MNINFWKSVKHFRPSEFKYPDELDRNLVRALDRFRELCGKPIVVHSDYRPDDGGQHGLGEAADVHVKDMHVIDQFLMAERSGLFVGIGVYPNWNSPGLHLDIRRGASARWGCFTNGIYIPLNNVFFRKALEKERQEVE